MDRHCRAPPVGMICVRLLVTRPEPDGEQTAAGLRALGHEVLVSPLLHIESMPEADLGAGPWTGIVMTSSNAARALARHPRYPELTRLPVFAVGRRTAAAARAAGFSEVVSAEGDAEELVDMIKARHHAANAALLYLAGADRAADVAGALTAGGLRVDTVVIYRAVATRELPAAVRTALSAGGIDGVLHFSRRSAEIYLGCAERAGLLDKGLALSQYCLSRQVSEPLAAAGARNVAIAARPTEVALFDLIGPDQSRP
jgi:uroporphyrinogen-III synthase